MAETPMNREKELTVSGRRVAWKSEWLRLPDFFSYLCFKNPVIHKVVKKEKVINMDKRIIHSG